LRKTAGVNREYGGTETLQREVEWLLSDEQVDGSIRANEYEFTEYGHVW